MHDYVAQYDKATRGRGGGGGDDDDVEAQQGRDTGHDGGRYHDEGSDDEGEDGDDDDDDTASVMSLRSFDDHFKDLEEEVAVLIADVHDLALYTKLNFTGFMKIVKKHDKVTGFELKPDFSHEYLDKHPFYKFNYDGLILKLSDLFNYVKHRGHPAQGDSSAGGKQQDFVRSTTKYWVHPDNIVHLKLAILKHLPVMVFDTKKVWEPADSAISSIYFDNPDLDLYLGRLEKTEGAEAIRFRWYGGMGQKTCWIEKKTHREDWTGEKSVKTRAPIPEHMMNDFIRGHLTMDAYYNELGVNKPGKYSNKAVEDMKALASEVQYAIIKKQLQPCMRTFYNRTAFQIGGDQTVRLSLDTELTMVREDNFDGKDRCKGNWRRMDIGIDWPFEQLDKSDVELFPYAVLEVKTATASDGDIPQWVKDLISSHLVEAVPKFSKFIHGCATLIPDRVQLVPFWLPQMDIDIRKPVNRTSKALQIERPHSANVSSGSGTPRAPSPTHNGYTEPVSEGEEDEEDEVMAPAADEAARLNLPPEALKEAAAAKEFREKNAKQRQSSQSGQQQPRMRRQSTTTKHYGPRLDIDPLAPSKAQDGQLSKLDARTLQNLFKAQEDGKSLRSRQPPSLDGDDEDAENIGDGDEGAAADNGGIIQTREFRAPQGKMIVIPVRIEPKVHFANERTFLKWLHFSVLLATIATTLLNFIAPDDAVGLLSAACFTGTALLAILYSAGMYTLRVMRLRKRLAISYHDPYGPTLLCVALIASVLVNLGLRLREI